MFANTIIDGYVMRECAKCRISKPFSEYHSSKVKRDGIFARCKTCWSVRAKDYYQKTKHQQREKQKLYNKTPAGIAMRKKAATKHKITEKYKISQRNAILRKYGLTAAQYDVMSEKQNNVCAICQLPEYHTDKRYNKVKNLAVDHNHTTGQIRGLLCSDCNTMIGRSEERITVLKKAIDYLLSFAGSNYAKLA